MKYLFLLSALALLAACDQHAANPQETAKAAAAADCRAQANDKPNFHGMTTPADMQANKASRETFIQACMVKKGY